MADDVQIKAWEVLTCPNGHPMWVVVRPILRKGMKWGVTPLVGLGGISSNPETRVDWICQECHKCAFGGGLGMGVGYST